MVGQDRKKQERLLNFAGWLHHRHGFATREHGAAYTEVSFTREDLGAVPAFAGYAPETGDAGEQALGRDTSALADFGIEVRWDHSRKVWISRASPLTDAECQALATAALSVLIEDGSSIGDRYHVPGAGLSVEGAELIVAYARTTDTLVDAIQNRTPVTIGHRGNQRTLDPWQVLMVDGRWYLAAYDHSTNEERVFAIDAIESVVAQTAGARYEIPRRDFAEIAVHAADPDSWTDSDPVDVHLLVDQRLVARAERLLGARATREAQGDDRVPMTCSVRNVDAFIDRLWGLRTRAVVTGPPDVRSQIRAALTERI